MFELRGKYFFITIENRKILYYDKLHGSMWGGPIQYLPPDPTAFRRIDNSRNRIPQEFKELLRITPEDMAEFEKAQTDEELKDIVLKDTKRHGCKLIDVKIE
jgi:hypothetical protein